jgi:chemotaxis protein MotB
MSANKPIIVKKVKKIVGGHHGGAWKVAYADFVTAMMAFFLLLWLLSMSSDEKRIRLSTYFKHFSIYTEGGTSFMGKTSSILNESGENQEKVFAAPKGHETLNVEGMEEQLKMGISEELGGLQDHVLIDTVAQGIRIQVTDKEGMPMFERGESRLTPHGNDVIRSVGKNIMSLPNLISIEGHTDSVTLSDDEFSNWELSTARASTSMKELVAIGLSASQIDHVSGFADTAPLIENDPSDPRNRRISIIIGFPRKKDRSPTEKPYNRENIQLKPLANQDVIKSTPTQKVVEDAEGKTAIRQKPKKNHVINNDLNPVIDNSDNQHVIDKAWVPIMEENEMMPLEKESVSKPLIKEESDNSVTIDKNSDVEKLPSINKPSAGVSSGNAKVIHELSGPIINPR